MEKYDIAIIGAGPGGISAAITSKLRGKSVIIFGSRGGGKLEKTHLIQNYPGFPNVSGKDLADALYKHLEAMDISLTEAKVSMIYPMGKSFSIQAGETIYEASTCIISTGVVAGKPLPGEDELLGRGVSYCATCDAPLYKGKTAVVIGYNQKEESEASYLNEVAESVIYIPVYKEDVNLSKDIRIINENPLSISENNGKRVVETDGGSYECDGVFVLRDSISPGKLLPGLETLEAHIVVDRNMATNIPGCFACGDITGTPYQYIKAAGEGNIAALSAVAYLAKA